ncbi:MAG: flippase-like domain-containing protein [Cytophagaceae bacterium]|nr:flippase-like domain-containing protein [Cytophagaceae bacterium]
MSSMVKTIIKYLITLIVGVFLLWYLVDQQSASDKEEIKRAFFVADYFWIGVTIIISIIEKIFRAHRWNLLMEPVTKHPSLKNTFYAVMVAYLANIFLPRMGEVARCGILKKTDNIPVETSFGTVVSERIIDFLCLLILIGVSLIIEFEKINDLLYDTVGKKFQLAWNFLVDQYWILILTVLAMIAAGVYLYFIRTKINNSKIFIKIKEFGGGVINAIISIKKLKRKNEFVLYTALIWICYFFMTYLAFYSLDATSGVPLSAGIIILVVGGLGMSAPVQAGIGAFHFFVQKGLKDIYEIDAGGGLSYAFLVHTSQTALAFFLGLICLFLALNISRKTKISLSNVNQ